MAVFFRRETGKGEPRNPGLEGGVPGTGKPAFCKALGAETNRSTLILGMRSLMGSLVGSTEANVRRALRMIDAIDP